MQSCEERRLRVRNGLWYGRDPQGALTEGLEPESQGFQLGIEVPRLRREVFWQSGDDRAGKRDGLGPQALGEPLVQDTLVRPVLVEDDELLTFLGNDTGSVLQTSRLSTTAARRPFPKIPRASSVPSGRAETSSLSIS